MIGALVSEWLNEYQNESLGLHELLEEFYEAHTWNLNFLSLSEVFC